MEGDLGVSSISRGVEGANVVVAVVEKEERENEEEQRYMYMYIHRQCIQAHTHMH